MPQQATATRDVVMDFGGELWRFPREDAIRFLQGSVNFNHNVARGQQPHPQDYKGRRVLTNTDAISMVYDDDWEDENLEALIGRLSQHEE